MNISDIAKLAGVSSSAVSRYFNDGYISEEKREAIRKVVEQTGYRPSVPAQNLRTRKTNLIGVILPRIDSFSMARVVEGILRELEVTDYHMMLAVTQNDPKREIEYLRVCRDKQVNGVIMSATVMTPAHRKALAEMEIPIVLVGQDVRGCQCIYHDDYHAMYDMTRYVLSLGRTRLSYIGVLKEDKAAGAGRTHGYQDAVRDAGMPQLADRTEIAGFDYRDGYEAAGRICERFPDSDALICATDKIAAGAMRYLRDQGIHVPEQIAVTGAGDSELARVVSPTLTTIHYHYEDSGTMAVRMLIGAMSDCGTGIHSIKMGYSLVKSESTGEKAGGRDMMASQ